MKVSYEEELATCFGLQRKGDFGNEVVLSGAIKRGHWLFYLLCHPLGASSTPTQIVSRFVFATAWVQQVYHGVNSQPSL